MKERVWEIDFIRGIAIILMFSFHLVFDLKEYYSYFIEYSSGFWYYEGKLSAILFMLMAGISSTFSKSNLTRGNIVLGFGLILTIFSYIFVPEIYIRFGILHLLGSSMILFYLMKDLKNTHLFLIATSVVFLGNIFSNFVVANPYLFIFGFINKDFATLDYYPLFPWFGVFLYGVIAGRTLYSRRESLFPIPHQKFEYISYLGQHSLLIYLTHQPMILAMLFIIHKQYL